LDTLQDSEQEVLHIRASIALAQQYEANQHSLEKYLASRLPELHRTISLPENNASDTLIDFVTRYIEHVPEFVEAMTQLTKCAGIYPFTKKFIDIAEAYFIQPPEIVSSTHKGLHALIDEAYLAHRLIEEVNDRVMMLSDIPLVPMDMTISNLVIHDLLGDEFANQLDLAVNHTIESLFNEEEFLSSDAFTVFKHQHQQNGWQGDLERWPCLAGDSSISIALNYRFSSETLH